jgi:hypothetical protein
MRLAFKRGWWGAVLPGQVPKLTLQVGPVHSCPPLNGPVQNLRSESREKMWISPGSADYRYLKDVIEDKRWLKDLTHINKYCHTRMLA